MFAVIKTGGKQYRVEPNDVLIIERLEGEVGSSVSFAEVLMIGGDTVVVGTPMIAGATVTAELVEQKRARKVIAFKKRRRHNYKRRRGHRQEQTVVRITDILAEAGKPRRIKKAEPDVAAPEAAAPAASAA